MQNIGFGTLVNCFYIPGCIVGGFLMDRIGRKNTMVLGFVLWSILGFILGGALGPIQSIFPLFVVLYGILGSLSEMGPGVSLTTHFSYPELELLTWKFYLIGRNLPLWSRIFPHTFKRPFSWVCSCSWQSWSCYRNTSFHSNSKFVWRCSKRGSGCLFDWGCFCFGWRYCILGIHSC